MLNADKVTALGVLLHNMKVLRNLNLTLKTAENVTGRSNDRKKLLLV